MSEHCKTNRCDFEAPNHCDGHHHERCASLAPTHLAERTVSALGDGRISSSRFLQWRREQCLIFGVVHVGYCLSILWSVQLNARSVKGQYDPLYGSAARDGRCVAQNTASIAIDPSCC